MDSVVIIAGILGAVLAGAISPGPSFILVCRTAMLHSRKAGIAAALGMGVGGALFACLALFGLAALLKEAPSLHMALRILGGAYLLYLAFRIWLGAKEPLVVQANADGSKAVSLTKVFGLSLLTQVSNPKTAVFYGSIFTTFLPSAPSLGMLAAIIVGGFITEFGWYVIVATLFSISRPREAYLSAKTNVDRIVASILGLLGGRLALEALSD